MSEKLPHQFQWQNMGFAICGTFFELTDFVESECNKIIVSNQDEAKCHETKNVEVMPNPIAFSGKKCQVCSTKLSFLLEELHLLRAMMFQLTFGNKQMKVSKIGTCTFMVMEILIVLKIWKTRQKGKNLQKPQN